MVSSMFRCDARAALLAIALSACQAAPSPSIATPRPDAASLPAISTEASFVSLPPRDVTLREQPIHLAATSRLFYDLRPADVAPAEAPIVFLSNGFAAEIVRAYGTGPMTVALDGGAVVPNLTPLTAVANLVYLDPRQAGYSYDILDGGPPDDAACASTVFNEYVDAADWLLGALAVLNAHPELHGPVYWMGESYAGVRITWLLAYLRGRWDLASYDDPTLAAAIASQSRGTTLRAGQILLEAWLAGGADTLAIAAECTDPIELAAVSATMATPCAGDDACECAIANDRSLYDFAFTTEYENLLESQASLAHILPARAEALLGVPLGSIPLLAASQRGLGFKCSPPDDTVPAEDAIVAALGPLPTGQAYFVPYSPLEPGKEAAGVTFDWQTNNAEALAFVDNLRDVPAFLTSGALDLVVPTLALAPALQSVIGDAGVATSASGITIESASGLRTIDVYTYATAGHMITMVEPSKLAADLEAWLERDAGP
jgi:hypothetical protein